METFITAMDAILKMANIAIIAYGLYKFLGKPHTTLEQRVIVLEKDIEDLKREKSETQGQIRDINETLEVIQECMLALIEFEIQFFVGRNEDIPEELKHAKEKLHSYLSKIR